MKSLLKKVSELALEVEREKGQGFILFALVLPEDAISWDLVAAANWMDADKMAALRYLARKAQTQLTVQELRELSGIVPFDSQKVLNYSTSSEISTGWIKNDPDFYGRAIQRAYVFSAPMAVVTAH